MMKKYYNTISFKLGLLFSGIFLILLILLGYILFSLFTQLFLDYVTQDLLVRGNNHALVLTENFKDTTIKHVGLMEKNVVTSVIVTDSNYSILTSSDPIDSEMGTFLKERKIYTISEVLNKNWENYRYITTVSPIDNGKKGYVFMFYPTSVLQETVAVLKGFIAIASIGVILIAVGLIGFFSKKMTNPLLKMKEATNKMAKGLYKQNLEIRGNDELAQLGDSIQQLGEQLQYFEESRNDFLASVSHELRTPLTYIKGYSDVLMKGVVTDTEEIQKYLQVINNETKRVSHLVNDLFELSKVQTGKYTLHKESVNLSHLLQKVVNTLSPSASEKGLSISFKETKVTELLLDPNRMEQVFYNLIENAIKYSDKGTISIDIIEQNKEIEVRIKDNGIGIPEKDISKVWDRFYRVDKSRARKTGGSGLGLNVVREIVQLHGGEVAIQSKEGKGTTVYVKLFKRDVVS